MEPSAAGIVPFQSLSDSLPPVPYAQETPQKKRRRRKTKAGEWEDPDDEPKRRVVSTACVACRKRKSKCDGNTPACAACSQVYNTQCIYDPNSDHRRKGVYRQDSDSLRTREATLNTIIQAIINYPEDDVPALIKKIRDSDNLETVAEEIAAEDNGTLTKQESDDDEDGPFDAAIDPVGSSSFESQLGLKMGELRLDDGSVRYIGGTSHLLFLDSRGSSNEPSSPEPYRQPGDQQQEDPVTSWTNVTNDRELIMHLLNLYFTWHYTYFTCLSRPLFQRSFFTGRQAVSQSQDPEYCSSLLVNAILSLGCHFTSRPAARGNPFDATTAGDHFFREAKRLILENDEHEKPRITTVQALALMSVREAGCGRESRGWVYSGMSFRMAGDMGLHLDSSALVAARQGPRDPNEEDARRITFWGCFLFDKCWSNYLGRLPQLAAGQVTCPKFDVFPDEDAAEWMPYGDSGAGSAHRQPARTRAIALQISTLCEISSDLMRFFYNPGAPVDAGQGKGKQVELKKLSEIEIRLQRWRKDLPKELEPRDGALASVFVMHMFFQLLFIHLFRPFLKYTASTSPLPATVSPRKICTTAATAISRLARLYKRSYGLRQICNICVYMLHTACTIHLLNLPNREARRDIVHGVRQLEEIAESWSCARRTLGILDMLARQWRVELPPDAATVLERCGHKFGDAETRFSPSPPLKVDEELVIAAPAQSTQPRLGQPQPQPQQQQQQQQQQPQQSVQPQSASQQGRLPAQSWPQNDSLISYPIAMLPQAQQPNYLPYPLPDTQRDPPRIFGSARPNPTTTSATIPSANPNVPGPTFYAPPPPQVPLTPATDFPLDLAQGKAVDWALADQRDLAWGLGNWDFSGTAAAAAVGGAAAGGTPASSDPPAGVEGLEGWDVGFDMGFGDGETVWFPSSSEDQGGGGAGAYAVG